MIARVSLLLAVAVVGCTHDWERFEPVDGAGGSAVTTASTGVGGAATLSACQEVCKAERECANLEEAPTCLEDCAARAADCSSADVAEVEECGQNNQVVCSSFIFTECTPGCF